MRTGIPILGSAQHLIAVAPEKSKKNCHSAPGAGNMEQRHRGVKRCELLAGATMEAAMGEAAIACLGSLTS
jgi:hypothetical protein